jgi:hypothetical protein
MSDKKNPIMTKRNDAEIISQLANYQAKILKIENLLKLAPYSEVNIFFYAKEMFCSVDQSMLPFNLGIEIDLLLRESINYYEQKIEDCNAQLR